MFIRNPANGRPLNLSKCVNDTTDAAAYYHCTVAVVYITALT